MSYKKVVGIPVLLLVFALSVTAQTQFADPINIVNIDATGPDEPVHPGAAFTFMLRLNIQHGWHINAHKPLDEFLIPTAVSFEKTAAVVIDNIEYPEPKLAKFSFSETRLAVYEGEVTIPIRMVLREGVRDSVLQIFGELGYQACNDVACLQPISKAFAASVRIQPAAQMAGIDAAQSGAIPEARISLPIGQTIDEEVVRAEVKFSLDKALPGSEVKAAILLDISNGWHINSNTPRDEFLIPTTVSIDPVAGAQIGEPVYPAHKLYRFSFSENDVAVYEGQTAIGVLLQIESQASGDAIVLSGEVQYQACNDDACMLPATVSFSGTLPIANRSESIALVNAELFGQIDFGASSPARVERRSSGDIGGIIESQGLALAFVFIFLGGLALNLTPCVYPLIPITISFFGGQAHGSTARMFSLALVYLLGMAITYSTLGVVAALSGSLFGAALQSPLAIIFLASIMIALALSMFGLWELTPPQSLNQMAGGSRRGYVGALIMGLTVGIVAAPCIGPFVLGLLTYVGAKGDPLLGFWMFFTLSLGLGLPYVVLGTFSGSIKNLPRSGIWMVWVKKVFGFILLGMAAYFLMPVLPDWLSRFLLPAVLLVGGVVVGFIDRTQNPSRAFPLLKKAVGVAFIGIAAWLAWPADTSHQEHWQPYSPEAIAAAQAAGKPVIIDFTADWCISCKELEKYTFPSEPVMSRADRFAMLRADLTQFASPPVEAIKHEFDIKGLPTIVFLNSSGVEQRELRVVGFVNGEEFAQRMDKILAGRLSALDIQ